MKVYKNACKSVIKVYKNACKNVMKILNILAKV